MLLIGSVIQQARLQKGLTQARLASLCGIPQPNLSNIERGKRDITIATLRRIAVALSVHPGEFFSDFNPEPDRMVLSRRRIERLAKVISDRNKPSNSEEREISKWFKKILPDKGKVRVRELNQAWLELRKRFTSQEINSVYERTQEHQDRPL